MSFTKEDFLRPREMRRRTIVRQSDAFVDSGPPTTPVKTATVSSSVGHEIGMQADRAVQTCPCVADLAVQAELGPPRDDDWYEFHTGLSTERFRALQLLLSACHFDEFWRSSGSGSAVRSASLTALSPIIHSVLTCLLCVQALTPEEAMLTVMLRVRRAYPPKFIAWMLGLRADETTIRR